MPDDVIVIGSGAAGLAAAVTLAEAGHSVCLLEARSRLGGRIHTVHDPAAPVPVELGAEFIHGRPTPTFDRVDAFGLPVYESLGNSLTLRRGGLRTEPDFFDQVGQTMSRLDRLPDGEDCSFDAFLDQYLAGDDVASARHAACAFVEGFDAADPTRISARALAEEWTGLGNMEQAPQYRMVRGYGALMEAMAVRARALGAAFHLGTRATAVRWRRGHVAVEGALANGSTTIFEANRAVVTLPLPFLQAENGGHGGPPFEPDVSTIREAARGLVMGPVVKVILVFRSPFWEEVRSANGEQFRDLGFLLAPDAVVPTFWTTYPVRSPVLTAWTGGPKAAALSGQAPQALVRAALEPLTEAFGRSPAALAADLGAAHTADWLADPLALGAYSYVGVGGMGAHQALAQPVEETLFFAGEHADSSGQSSTVAGALSSGAAAAHWIIQA